MNSFEALLWTSCACVLIRTIKTGNQKLWIWFGLLAGIGLENKHSMLIWGVAITAGLLLTPQRQFFRTPWIWLAGLVAFLIFLPNLIWNFQHHFPFLKLQANIRRSGRNAHLTSLSFFGQEVLSMHPMTLPIWLAGLWFYLFSEIGKPFRVHGWAWVFTAGVILALDPRVPISSVPNLVRCWRCHVGIMGAVAAELAKVWLSGHNGPLRRFDRLRLQYRYCRSRLTFDIRRR